MSCLAYVEVKNTLNSFIQVFSQLELEEMMKYFSDKATAFLPVSPNRSHLHKGKQQIADYFEWLIKQVKSTGVSNMRIVPEELQVQLINDFAIVTFKIIGDSILRRTFVF